LVGPETADGPWYFSLNNRRLWVLKRCREEGLLKDNQIAVRVRQPKSASEASRYTVENCALEAKIMRETLDHKPNSVTNGEPKKGDEPAVSRIKDLFSGLYYLQLFHYLSDQLLA
jgi:hypothetical protein